MRCEQIYWVCWMRPLFRFSLYVLGDKLILAPANHPLQRQKRIFADLRPCFAFDETRRCCITSYCVQIKPLQLITTYGNYTNWVTSWCKKDQPTIAKSFCWMVTLDCCEKCEANTSRPWMRSSPASSVLSTFGIVWLSSLPIDAKSTYEHTLLQLRRSKKIDRWMVHLERHCSIIIRLPCCQRDGKK